MDELMLLRELDPDPPPLTPDARRTARERLERQIGRPSAPRPPRRLWNAQRAAWLFLALSVVFGLVVVARDIVSGGDANRPELLLPDPAEDVLQLAARGGEGLALPPTPRPDQYIYTRETTEADPVDPAGTQKTFEEEEWRSMDSQLPSRTCEIGRCWTAQGGAWPSVEELARVPREPRDLVLRATGASGPYPEGEPVSLGDWLRIYDYLIRLLRTPLIVPHELRSAAVKALAYMPDAEVSDQQLEFRGRPAAVVDIPIAGSRIIIDRYTHEYLGERWELGPQDMRGRNATLFNSSRVRLVSYRVEAAIVDRLGERP